MIVSEAYFLHYLSSESQILCVVASWDGRMSCTSFRVTLNLTFFLEFSYQEYIPILFEVGIPNLVHGCIFGFRYVADHFKSL